MTQRLAGSVLGLSLLCALLPAWSAEQSSPATPAPAGSSAPPVDAYSVSGTLASGALWKARVPAHWSGTLLLFSHGYSPVLRPPEIAPPQLEDWLLAHGYALAASAYSAPGWALAEAVPDQLATLDAFQARVAKPQRTIAWGQSMGGLVTVALAESVPRRIDGALPSCGSIGGSLGMMNQALDAAFAFVTLQAPSAGLQIVRIADDRANGARAADAVAEAMKSPAGRAHLALAAALAQLPGWTDPHTPPPGPSDPEAQLEQIAHSFAMGVFLPRNDQEQRAGGVFSWNTGIDYREQLRRSGRTAWVAAFYRKAGLNLAADLRRLNATPRIHADPKAVAYMRAHYVPSGALQVPLLSYHTIGDGATMATLQGAYAAAVQQAGHAAEFRDAWVEGAGHCAFAPAEHIAALQTLQARLDTGHWATEPVALNARAQSSGLGHARFVAFKPAPFLRPCTAAERRCAGEEHSSP